MSERMWSSDSADPWAVRTYSSCSGVSAVRRASESIPMTPFSGVRISWLMLARNSDLARVACSAASLASSSSASTRFRSPMSLSMPTVYFTVRSGFRTQLTDSMVQTNVPSLRRKRLSSEYPSISPASSRSNSATSGATSSGWVRSSQVRWASSSRVYPSMVHAAALTSSQPFSGLVMAIPTPGDSK